MINIRPEVLEIFKRYIEENPEEASFDPIKTEKHHKFLELFPIELLKTISLQEYCLGEKDKYPDNFCWWLEHNLGDILGGYFAGNSYSHLIYWSQTEQKYNKSPKLKAYGDLDAMQQVGRLNYIIASVYPENNIDLLDNNSKLAELADTVEGLQLGLSRKLRITQAYYPGYFPTINSIDVIENYLKALGAVADETKRLVSAGKIYHLADILRQYYLEITKLLNIKDDLTINGFAKMWYVDEYKSALMNGMSSTDQKIISSIEYPLNQVLYGPPGTGKTYSTVEKAVEICAPNFFKDIENLEEDEKRFELKKKYDDLIANQQISFVTFHQSFSYEDFVEGIRAKTKSGQIEYDIEDGIFKEICKLAKNHKLFEKDSSIWKFSMGAVSEKKLRDYYIANGEARIGWNSTGDLSIDLLKRSEKEKKYWNNIGSNDQSCLEQFSKNMKIGDILLCLKDKDTVQAIGIIQSNYFFEDNDQEHDYFAHARKVDWVLKNISFNLRQLNNDIGLTQKTCYPLPRIGVNNLLEELQNQGFSLDLNKAQESYVLIIDEINRGNIANIFGELITLLEPSKRAGNDDERSVTLPYSKTPFSVPNNLYVIGTMNTSDHSLTKLDFALRRRFEFVELLPNYKILKDIEVHGINIGEMLEIMNERIEILIGRDYLIGHSYFLPLKDSDNKENMLSDIFKNKIIPLLQEYFFEDWERIQWVLNDQNKEQAYQFIHLLSETRKNDLSRLFGNLQNMNQVPDRRYQINEDAFKKTEAYSQILTE